jgi:hypothetical protein
MHFFYVLEDFHPDERVERKQTIGSQETTVLNMNKKTIEDAAA